MKKESENINVHMTFGGGWDSGVLSSSTDSLRIREPSTIFIQVNDDNFVPIELLGIPSSSRGQLSVSFISKGHSSI